MADNNWLATRGGQRIMNDINRIAKSLDKISDSIEGIRFTEEEQILIYNMINCMNVDNEEDGVMKENILRKLDSK